MNPAELSGRRAMVSGGGSGIGLEIALMLRRHGAQVLVSDLNAEALTVARSERLHTVEADAASEPDVIRVAETVDVELGGLDILVNNAGIAGPTASIDEVGLNAWQATMRVNVDSQFLHIKHLVSRLRQSQAASIINLSSAAGLRAFRDRSAYAASKWAVVGLTKTAAAELGPSGIRVNAVCPGVIRGPRLDAVIAAKAIALGITVDQARERFVAQTALGIPSSATDVANAVLFLSSDMSRTVSGQVLSVDGFIEKMA